MAVSPSQYGQEAMVYGDLESFISMESSLKHAEELLALQWLKREASASEGKPWKAMDVLRVRGKGMVNRRAHAVSICALKDGAEPAGTHMVWFPI